MRQVRPPSMLMRWSRTMWTSSSRRSPALPNEHAVSGPGCSRPRFKLGERRSRSARNENADATALSMRSSRWSIATPSSAAGSSPARWPSVSSSGCCRSGSCWSGARDHGECLVRFTGTPAGKLGLAGLVSNSVSSAADGTAHWYALLVGVPVLLFATRSVLRVLIGSHRILWGDARAAAPRPTILASLKLLALLLSLFVGAGVAGALRASSSGTGARDADRDPAGRRDLAGRLPHLPHGGSSWRALVPGRSCSRSARRSSRSGAAYLLAPYALPKQGTYGALGVAAALLLALFFISRLVVGAAIVNATLWERRTTPATRRSSPGRMKDGLRESEPVEAAIGYAKSGRLPGDWTTGDAVRGHVAPARLGAPPVRE